jgi:HPt (histidine-containing phosphotransfer) domain-containing protein
LRYHCFDWETTLEAQLPDPLDSNRPIDAASLLERCVGDASFVQLVLEKFQSTSDSMVKRISQSIETRDAGQLGRDAHMLKGAAANLSAEPVRAIARRLEEIGQRGDLALAEQALSELKQEVARCIAYFPAVKAQLQNA